MVVEVYKKGLLNVNDLLVFELVILMFIFKVLFCWVEVLEVVIDNFKKCIIVFEEFKKGFMI